MDTTKKGFLWLNGADWLRIGMLLLVFTLKLSANAQVDRISLNLTNVTLKDFIKQIESKTDFTL